MSNVRRRHDLRALAHVPARAELSYTRRYTEAFLESQRFVGDALADDVIRELKGRQPIGDPASLLAETRRLARSEGGVFADFLDGCHSVPAWADFRRMRPGMRLTATAAPLMGLSIFGIVVGSAWHTRAEAVFTGTGRFVVEKDVATRGRETSGIIFLPALRGTVQPGGRHHEMAMKVRLLHGAVRHHTLKRTGEAAYDVERWGLPINQEDDAYAMLLFGYLNLRGMVRLGLRPTDEQIDGLRLMWRYTSWVSGVGEQWLHEDLEEEKAMYRAILKHLAVPGQCSVAALNLLDGQMLNVPERVREPITRGIKALTADLGGVEYLDALKLDRTGSSTGYAWIKRGTRTWAWLLDSPLEPVVYRFMRRTLERAYGGRRGPADEHTYGVKMHSQQDIQRHLRAQRERLAKVG